MFDNFIQKVKENNWPIYGIEIFYRGEIADKYEFVPTVRHPIYSATKVFTSTAVGMAIEEGKISIKSSLYDCFKDEIPEDITKETLDTLHKISIKRLLTMSVPGYPFRMNGDNWLKSALTYPIQYSDTPIFDYSNIPAYLVAAAVEKAVGEHLINYLEPRLLKPLGIENPEYLNCPAGHFYGATGMYLTINELSRLGQLYLQNGYYNNKQIIPEKWVKESTSIQQMNKEGGYGYYFWKYKDGYRITGKWGQSCYIFPRQQIVITYMADLEEGPDVARICMEKEILPLYGI